MRIASNGNIGIGTATIQSSYKLQVQGNAWVENQLVFNNAYSGAGGADYACNKIALYGGVNTPTTTSTYGFGIRDGALDYFSQTAHLFYTGTTGGTTFGTERLRIASNGNIGIGTSDTATYKLNVNGTTRLNGTISYGYNTWHSDVLGNKKIWYGGEGRTYMLGGQNVAGATCFTFRRGDESIIAEMYYSGALYILGTLSQGSDSRIKMNIKDIDDIEALNLILAIEPKTYEYIDKETRGIETVYGFIAQQVKEVIPRAIQIVSDFLPNIYKMCDCEGDIIYCSIPDNVLINTELKLIYNNNETICKILEIGEDYIKIDKELEVDKVFVYGYSVDNFHRMSKEYIYTLNVCATQILSKKIEAQSLLIKSHEDRIKDLETKMERILSNT